MKKALGLVTLMAVAASAAFAEIAVGGGIFYGSFASKAVIEDSSKRTEKPGFGAFGFVDAKYLLGTVGYGKYDELGSLEVNAFGKYPIAIKKVVVFPMLGLGYQRAVSVPDGSDKDACSHFNVNAGVGADISVGDRLFVRPAIHLSYYFHNDDEKDLIDSYDALGLDAKISTYTVVTSVGVGYKL